MKFRSMIALMGMALCALVCQPVTAGKAPPDLASAPKTFQHQLYLVDAPTIVSKGLTKNVLGPVGYNGVLVPAFGTDFATRPLTADEVRSTLKAARDVTGGLDMWVYVEMTQRTGDPKVGKRIPPDWSDGAQWDILLANAQLLSSLSQELGIQGVLENTEFAYMPGGIPLHPVDLCWVPGKDGAAAARGTALAQALRSANPNLIVGALGMYGFVKDLKGYKPFWKAFGEAAGRKNVACAFEESYVWKSFKPNKADWKDQPYDAISSELRNVHRCDILVSGLALPQAVPSDSENRARNRDLALRSQKCGNLFVFQTLQDKAPAGVYYTPNDALRSYVIKYVTGQLPNN